MRYLYVLVAFFAVLTGWAGERSYGSCHVTAEVSSNNGPEEATGSAWVRST